MEREILDVKKPLCANLTTPAWPPKIEFHVKACGNLMRVSIGPAGTRWAALF
jgi:hypothetical protein